ncbi:hypothetical protein HZS_542 [Henneguya salminicola]|nr:hypothetical protein HZS_542 [Henneguya salminicola]
MCMQNYCLNDGIMLKGKLKNYFCLCLENFTGSLCEYYKYNETFKNRKCMDNNRCSIECEKFNHKN